MRGLGMNAGVPKREKWQKNLDQFYASIIDPDELAQDTIEDEARVPKVYKQRPGKYLVPGESETEPRNKHVTVSALYPLMSVLELRNLLHNDPPHKPPPVGLAAVNGSGSDEDDDYEEESGEEGEERERGSSAGGPSSRNKVRRVEFGRLTG